MTEKKSEFWLTVGICLVATVALFMRLLDSQQWMLICGPVAGLYVIGRSAVKSAIARGTWKGK